MNVPDTYDGMALAHDRISIQRTIGVFDPTELVYGGRVIAVDRVIVSLEASTPPGRPVPPDGWALQMVQAFGEARSPRPSGSPAVRVHRSSAVYPASAWQSGAGPGWLRDLVGEFLPELVAP